MALLVGNDFTEFQLIVLICKYSNETLIHSKWEKVSMNYEYTFKCAWNYEDTLNYKYATWNITVINLYGMSGTKY